MKEMDWEWARLADQVPTRRLKLREEEAPAELVCRKGRSLCAFCIDDGGKEGGQPFFCPKKRTDSVSDDRPPCPRCQSWAENRSITGSLTHSRLHFPHLHPRPLRPSSSGEMKKAKSRCIIAQCTGAKFMPKFPLFCAQAHIALTPRIFFNTSKK